MVNIKKTATAQDLNKYYITIERTKNKKETNKKEKGLHLVSAKFIF